MPATRTEDNAQPSYPRQSARTQHFTRGAPRSLAVSADGSRVLFVRSEHGTDPVGRLWSLDVASGSETLLADPSVLLSDADRRAVPGRTRSP